MAVVYVPYSVCVCDATNRAQVAEEQVTSRTGLQTVGPDYEQPLGMDMVTQDEDEVNKTVRDGSTRTEKGHGGGLVDGSSDGDQRP